MATNMTSGASSASGQWKWKYDVFLSFSGEDTRTNFTDHLFNALIESGIQTFRDNEELNRGGDISSQLMAAIEDSRVAIIVFSQNYASSTWCLGELQKILDCKRDDRLEKVLPVFYKIDPSDVRKQSNTYAQAFMRHEERFQNEKERVEKWRSALTEAANLSGWDQQKVANGHEAELIKNIVKEVLAITSPGQLHVAKCLTALDSHIDGICDLLNEGGSDVVSSIGIYGPGGIGKTTIAKAVFNRMSQKFDGSCFLADVREVSSQPQGVVRLQKQLISDILKPQVIDIHNEHQGIDLINRHLRYKRVLIVFDDVVNHLDQLVGGVDSFYSGSQIILTTRDEHLLTQLDMDEKYKYRVETMDENESLRLFSRHAFKQDYPAENYEQLSKQVVRYAGGLPLALVTLGSSLYNRTPIDWEYQLEKLKVIPLGNVFEKLKISYDALDGIDRNIFLDISCFFVGEGKDYVSMILDACCQGGAAAIKSLKEKSLVTIDEYDRVRMHDLIRDMGKEIVHSESPANPGERSRVWKADDAVHILRKFTGTDAIKGFDLSYYQKEQLSQMTSKAFSRMPNLILLCLNHGASSDGGGIIDWKNSLPKEVMLFEKLVWLYWGGFPVKYIPNNFHLGKLVILEMPNSSLKEFWKGAKNLKMLKVLDLSGSRYLTHMRDISELQNLERLDLSNCESLVKIDESIQRLKKPFFGRSLKKLDVALNLQSCDALEHLPRGINHLECLRTFNLKSCNKLKSLPMLPPSLYSLDVEYCRQLEKLPYLSNLKHIRVLDLKGCEEVTEIKGFEGLTSATIIDLRACVKLNTSMKNKIFQDISKEFGDGEICDIFLPGNDVPDWFCFQKDFQVTAQLHNIEMQPQQEGLIICCTFTSSEFYGLPVSYYVQLYNNSKKSLWMRDKVIGSHGETKLTWVIKIPCGVWYSIAAKYEYEYGDTVTVSAFRAWDEEFDICERSSARSLDAEEIRFHFF